MEPALGGANEAASAAVVCVLPQDLDAARHEPRPPASPIAFTALDRHRRQQMVEAGATGAR